MADNLIYWLIDDDSGDADSYKQLLETASHNELKIQVGDAKPRIDAVESKKMYFFILKLFDLRHLKQ